MLHRPQQVDASIFPISSTCENMISIQEYISQIMPKILAMAKLLGLLGRGDRDRGIQPAEFAQLQRDLSDRQTVT